MYSSIWSTTDLQDHSGNATGNHVRQQNLRRTGTNWKALYCWPNEGSYNILTYEEVLKGCDTSRCCKPVVLNHCFESRMWLPSTVCAALSSLSTKYLIFCVIDFVLL